MNFAMQCPQCHHIESRVLETRVQKDGEIRRRRECLNCKARFTTKEILHVAMPDIVKKDGRRETYSREKLRRGIQIACRKRPVSVAQIEDIVMHVSKWAERRGDREIKAEDLGRQVVARLKKLDDVAYVRFASVYKTFRDINEFVATLSTLESPAPHDAEKRKS